MQIWNHAVPGLYISDTTIQYTYYSTLVSQIVEPTERDEHLEEIAENLIVEHLFYIISVATNNRTPGVFPLR